MLIAAHDLRTPLAVIKLHVERGLHRRRAGDEPSGAEWAASMSRISRVADGAFGLIDDLLAVGRLHADDPTRSPSPSDVDGLVQEAIALQSELLDRARCKVTVLRDKNLSEARGPWDRSHLLRVFSNLLRNVARHAPGAPVNITLARRGNRLGIVFADRGPGFPAKADATAASPDDNDRSSAKESHGLGLWIVHRAVELLNGSLRIRNTPGRGVAFDIELPGLQASSR